MNSVFLGGSGLKVSELALGTQTFGWGADQETANALADRFAEAGGIFFDTSSTYNGGASEAMLGCWLKARACRHSIVVATKVFFATGDGLNDFGLSRKHILQTAEESLRRLQTDYVDLYQAHCYDMSTPLEETLRAFDDLVRSGKTRYIGVSNFTASQLIRALLLCRANGWSPLVSLQAEYSLLVRSTEWELLPACQEERLGLLAWSPLAGGWLSGKYRKGREPDPNSRVGRVDRWEDQPEQRESELAWGTIDALKEIGRSRGKSPAQVALNFLLRRSELIVPVLGARTLDQLTENLGGAGWKLAADEVRMLEAASASPLPYPYSFIERYTRRRNADKESADVPELPSLAQGRAGDGRGDPDKARGCG